MTLAGHLIDTRISGKCRIPINEKRNQDFLLMQASGIAIT